MAYARRKQQDRQNQGISKKDRLKTKTHNT